MGLIGFLGFIILLTFEQMFNWSFHPKTGGIMDFPAQLANRKPVNHRSNNKGDKLINFKAHSLKEFKKQLKFILKQNHIRNYVFRTYKENNQYEAKFNGDMLLVIIPGIKKINGKLHRVRYNSIQRRQHTLRVFINKRRDQRIRAIMT